MLSQIIVLEDHPIALAAILNILHAAGYRPLPATTYEGALQHIRRGGNVDLIIADMFMTPLTGADAALQALRIASPIKVLLTSGTPINLWTTAELTSVSTLPSASVAFLQKPFDSATLLMAVKELLSQPDAATDC